MNYIETCESVRKTMLTFLVISLALFILTPLIMSATGIGYLPLGITDLILGIITLILFGLYGTL